MRCHGIPQARGNVQPVQIRGVQQHSRQNPRKAASHRKQRGQIHDSWLNICQGTRDPGVSTGNVSQRNSTVPTIFDAAEQRVHQQIRDANEAMSAGKANHVSD